MSAKWNINNIRKIAGLPINEAWDRDDGDDEDPDVKIAMGDKRQQAFEKKNKPELDAAKKAMADKAKAQKEASAKKKEETKAAPAAAKKEETKPAPKKEEAKPEPKKEEAKAEEKKEESPAAEAKRRGAKPNENSKSQRAAAWIKANSSAKRGEFLKWARENLEMGSAYGSAFFARHNPKAGRQQVTKESWVITHPSMPSFLLAENFEMGTMQWIDPSSPMEPMIFNSRAAAEKTSKYMAEWKSQFSTIEHIILED